MKYSRNNSHSKYNVSQRGGFIGIATNFDVCLAGHCILVDYSVSQGVNSARVNSLLISKIDRQASNQFAEIMCVVFMSQKVR